MKPTSILATALALGLVLLTACDETEVTVDAAVDAHVPGDDGGRDAGIPPTDASPPPTDAATTADGGRDAGADLDAGDDPAPRNTFEVLAGETATGFVDGVGSMGRMNGMSGAAISPDGTTIYVADTFNSLFRAIDIATGELTTVIGAPGETAVVDGTGLAARVGSPRGTGVAPDGTIYLADTNTIRRIALPGFEIETIAGVAGESGYVDGVGAEARFAFLVHDIEVSADGSVVYLADRSNRVIRALDPVTREVTTVAGVQYTGGFQHADGTGDEVRMSALGGLARVGDTLYFADTFNHCIRRFDPGTGAVTTIAGDPDVRGNADGVGAAASFDTPQQLSTDGDNLYVMGFNGAIRRVRLSDLQVDTILGDVEDVRAVDGVGAEVRLGVSFGPSPLDAAAGILYFNDRDANSFRAVELDTLTVRTVAGAVEPRGARDGAFAIARFASPDSIACSSDGTLCYVSDRGNHTIRALDRLAGEVFTLAGAAGDPDFDDGAFADARFAGPRGLALDEANGLLFVADTSNHTIRVLDLMAETVTTLAGEAEISGFEDGIGEDALFDGPTGIVLSADGSALYVTESGNRCVRVVDLATGAVSLLAGDPESSPADDDGTGTDARFRSPGGMTLSPDGSMLYLGDRAFTGNVIRTVAVASGEVATLVGVPSERGVIDGDFETARLNGPWGLVFSPEGFLLVAELRNSVVRRVDLAMEQVAVWLGDPEIEGNLPFGMRVGLDESTFFFPAALAVAGDDLLVLAEDAVLIARPEGPW